MSSGRDRNSGEGSDPHGGLPGAPQSATNVPLVIVSERGRHDEAARRVVRAQAARASAAQSRITRARNREEREAREGPLSPIGPDGSPTNSSFGFRNIPGVSYVSSPLPLLSWLNSIPSITETALKESPNVVASAAQSVLPFNSVAAGSSLLPGLSQGSNPSSALDGGRQLPWAVPRGFAELRNRVDISTNMITLISRTACFDFASPGVEGRLHQLIFDLVMSSVGAGITALTLGGHPIQGHVRIACTCLTIFAGQRADGQIFASDPRYHAGLSAAWAEVVLLDQGVLAEPKTAQASLWAVFIISVTTGAGAAANIFHQLLHVLLQDLNVKMWEQVRSILLSFIYPVSFLDEPCRHFYHNLQNLRIGLAQ